MRACARRSAALIVLSITFGTAAHADENDEEKAERLFVEGRELLVQGRVAEACARLEASLRLSPAGGAMLNLAECYERAGRITSAWERFREAKTRAEQTGRKDAEQIAADRAARLEPRLPRLIVVIETPYEAIVVRRDGELVTKSLWGTAVPVDPGLHEIVAEVPGRVPFRWSGNVGEGAHVEVRVPALLPMVIRTEPRTPPPLRWIGLGTALAGVGVAGLGAGFLAYAVSVHNRALAACPMPAACNEATPIAWGREARTTADTAGVLFVAGGVVALAGIGLFLFAPTSSKSAGVSPGPGLAGLSLVGRY